MPGESNFTLAAVLRRKAQDGGPAVAPVVPASVAVHMPEGPVLPLSEADLQQLAIALATALAKLAPPRNTDAGPRWDLPERRRYRYRQEDLTTD